MGTQQQWTNRTKNREGTKITEYGLPPQDAAGTRAKHCRMRSVSRRRLEVPLPTCGLDGPKVAKGLKLVLH